MPILRPLWNQVQTLQPPYCLSIFSVGLHNPHSHPRTLSGWVTIAKVALLFIVVSPAAGSHTSLSHGPWVGKFFLLGKTLTVIPRGLQGLSPKGGIGVLGYIRPTTFSTSAPIHHHGDTSHFHLLVAAWGSVPTSQGLIPVRGSVLTNLGFCPHPRFCPHHLWSMTTLSLPLGGLLVGVVSMRGKGHWLGVGGSVRVY